MTNNILNKHFDFSVTSVSEFIEKVSTTIIVELLGSKENHADITIVDSDRERANIRIMLCTDGINPSLRISSDYLSSDVVAKIGNKINSNITLFAMNGNLFTYIKDRKVEKDVDRWIKFRVKEISTPVATSALYDKVA